VNRNNAFLKSGMLFADGVKRCLLDIATLGGWGVVQFEEAVAFSSLARTSALLAWLAFEGKYLYPHTLTSSLVGTRSTCLDASKISEGAGF